MNESNLNKTCVNTTETSRDEFNFHTTCLRETQHNFPAALNKRLVSYRGAVVTLPVSLKVSAEVWVKDTSLDSQSLLLYPATAR